MAWNRKNTILEAGSTAEIDADVIFTSAFVGLASDFARQHKKWRVAMEPELELTKGKEGDQRSARTVKDKESMTKHNLFCTLVNHIVRRSLKSSEFTLGWGFSPSFTAGGMIAGGTAAEFMDGTLNSQYKEVARKYLTAAKSPSTRTDPWEMYIGRGAYCGLVVDDDGNAVTAMSTVRTTLKDTTLKGNENFYPDPLDKQVGDRWCPPSDHPGYANKDSTKVDVGGAHKTWIWGMIKDADTQVALQSQGMKFYCGNDNQKGLDVVGYTHGLPRCVYECVRAKKGHPYEMSIGVNTFKLASCMGCTFFMIANGFTPSASHVGRSESWSPLYHVFGNNPSTVLAPLDDEHDQIKAFELANNRWADAVTSWMKQGVLAVAEVTSEPWEDSSTHIPRLDPKHAASLDALKKRLSTVEEKKEEHRRVCCNLLLDAFTVHKGDLDRVVNTLEIGADPVEGDWWWDAGDKTKFEAYQNPYTDEQLKDLADLSKLQL